MLGLESSAALWPPGPGDEGLAWRLLHVVLSTQELFLHTYLVVSERTAAAQQAGSYPYSPVRLWPRRRGRASSQHRSDPFT